MGQGRWIIVTLAFVTWLSLNPQISHGSYRNSAHGDVNFGVNRSAIDGKMAGYATGNCAHCHEMHASIEGVEPQPAGGPAPQLLFFNKFNSARTQNPYLESDNFCFYCHSSSTGQRVTNQDYSGAFGGASRGSGPQSIIEAFNQASYHNLYDIWNMLRGNPDFPWFGNAGNPCSACHNPHLAKRNWDSSKPGFPLLSAVSRPGAHGSLWGETELMSSYVSYEAPYAFDLSREPAGIGADNGENTPDYVGLCTSCHNPQYTIRSTSLNRELRKINWGSTGEMRDKHGVLARDGANHFLDPYAATAAFKGNFVLSCIDCHEPHGSSNIMLLRRRINGEDLRGAITSTDEMGHICSRCHKDDLAAEGGTGQMNRWEFVHHGAVGAPYAKVGCTDCHEEGGGGAPLPISCGRCHGHGMDDSWAAARKTGRKTF